MSWTLEKLQKKKEKKKKDMLRMMELHIVNCRLLTAFPQLLLHGEKTEAVHVYSSFFLNITYIHPLQSFPACSNSQTM